MWDTESGALSFVDARAGRRGDRAKAAVRLDLTALESHWNRTMDLIATTPHIRLKFDALQRVAPVLLIATDKNALN